MKISITVYKTIELKTEVYASSLSAAKQMIEDFDEQDFQSREEVRNEIEMEQVWDTTQKQPLTLYC